MIKRIKRALKIWKAAKHQDVLVSKEKLTDEQLQEVAKLLPGGEIVKAGPLGDGKAVFFGEPTPEEQLEFEREERGEKKWYDRLKRLP